MEGDGDAATGPPGNGTPVDGAPGDGAPPVAGHADPAGEAPWALQLVVRVEKDAPPTRTAVCEAAAMATVRMLHDARAQAGGEWAPQVERWLAGRIRKHCRRARGAAWEKVQGLAGVTVAHGGAEVRAFVPCPTDAVPRELARLQLSGLDLADPDARARVDPVPGQAVVVAICPDPPLSAGKAAAAAGHGAQVAATTMDARRLASWAAAGFPVVVEHPGPGRFASLVGATPVVIGDAGFTEIAPGTVTAVARWA